MNQDIEKMGELPTREGRLVVELSKAIFERDVDVAFRVLGEYLDDNNLRISAEVIDEYRYAGRIEPNPK